MNRLVRSLLLFLLQGLLAATALAQPAAPRENAIEVSLITGSQAVLPGGTVELAFVMRPRPGWHGYWQNPGDAGAPARVQWQLPAGSSAEEIRYPVPTRLMIAGLMNYVFERDYALLTRIRAGTSLTEGTRFPIRARLDYLACTDRICVPESAVVSTNIHISATPAPAANRAAIDRIRQALPQPIGIVARYEVEQGRLRIGVPLPRNVIADDPYFFPLTEGVIDYAAPQSISRSGDWLVIETPSAGPVEQLSGVLRIGDGRGLALMAEPGPVPAAGEPSTGRTGPQGNAAQILLALGGAVLAGLFLNLMPCVFPILSLKALSLAKAGENDARARRDALAYTAGLVLVCLGLGATLLALRAGGSAAGWAFQLQDPRVILFLLLLVTLIAANLAGLFELPSFGRGESLARAPGPAGAFWTGALAAFVATPCTGPFMGAALGAALILPGFAALAVFAGLGLGLALPFLLLGFIPALRRLLPTPGPWMVRLRHLLSIPMFLTAIALAWILARQTGTGVAAVAIAAAVLVLCLFYWASRSQAWLLAAPAAAAVAASALLLLPLSTAPAQPRAQMSLGAQPFSEHRLAALRAEGRPVFVYFTADWCLTCKVNEAAVLEREVVSSAFERRGVVTLVGDWTSGGSEIGRFLEAHGRSGIPLYLYYQPGQEVRILPQILTTNAVAGLAA